MGGVEIADLSQPLHSEIPCSPNHPGFRMILARRHGDRVREDGGSSANELIVTGGHVGTHVDALAHVSHKGQLHGGWDCASAQSGGSFSVHGVETIDPMICRGVLLDVAALYDTSSMPPVRPIGRDELEEAARRGGASPRPGDVCLVNTGWSRFWTDPAAYLGHKDGVPGVDESGAHWLAERGVRAAGSDTTAFEHIPPGRGHSIMPVHRIMLVDNGIYIFENMHFGGLVERSWSEFTFVMTPLRIVGATGSPVRPLALRVTSER